MRFATALALLSLAAQAQPRDPCDVEPYKSKMPRCHLRLAATYSFGTFALPTVESGAALCKVNAAGTEWECVGSTGAAAGSVAQGTGTTYQGTFAGDIKALSDITDAKAPVWTHSGLSIFAGDFTVIITGFATTASDATYQYWIEAGNFAIRNEGTSARARFGTAGLTADNVAATRDNWVIMTARKNGTSHTLRVNGETGTPNVFADDLPTGFGNIGFGSFLPLRGPMAWAYFVPRHLSDAEVAAIENQWHGAPALSVASASPQCIDNTAISGQVDCFAADAVPLVSATLGLRTVRAYQNFWSATPLSLASGTDVATPTITADVAAGPFSRMLNGALECDLMVDNNGAAFEGKQGATGGTGEGFWSADYFLAAGTSGTTRTTARITIDVAGGTGSTTCDVTGLTSTPTRAHCSTTAGDTPTSVRSSILVGNAAADTGSVVVCHSQMTASAYAEPPTRHGSAIGSSHFNTNIAAAPFNASRGRYEVVFTPLFDTNTQWLSNTDNIRLIDVSETSPGHLAYIIFGYQQAGDMQAVTVGGGGDPAQVNVAAGGLGLDAGQLYAASIEWTGNGSTNCTATVRLNACAGSVAACTATTSLGSGTGACPIAPDVVYLGERYSEQLNSSANYKEFRVYR